MEQATRRQERQAARELGWDKNKHGMETMLEFGFSLKRNGKSLKVGGL